MSLDRSDFLRLTTNTDEEVRGHRSMDEFVSGNIILRRSSEGYRSAEWSEWRKILGESEAEETSIGYQTEKRRGGGDEGSASEA